MSTRCYVGYYMLEVISDFVGIGGRKPGDSNVGNEGVHTS